MLPLFGSRKVMCDGITRRDLLHLGGLSLFGLGLGDWLGLRQGRTAEVERPRPFGKAKACILLYLYGSPPQHETFDPKPEAPAEIQGELKDIATRVPGLRIGEGLPRVASVMDRVTVVRSLTHPYPAHGVPYAITGIPTFEPAIEDEPHHPHQWPFLGSIVDYFADRRSGGKLPEVPYNIALPWVFYSRANHPTLAGPYAGFLGGRHDPTWAEFTGRGTRVAPHAHAKQQEDFLDPYGGIGTEGAFRVAALAEPLSPDRLGARRSLLEQFDRQRAWLDKASSVESYDHRRQQAFTLLTSSKMHRALDVGREPDAIRRRYGMTLFGQASLAARRLVEAGSKFVTVFWDSFGIDVSGWDTHFYHYPRLKNLLLPGFDQTYSALLLDLEARGLLEESLVLCLSEHGRTPHLISKPGGAGRDHWSQVYSTVLAGGGIARGKIVGRSDSRGGAVADTPVSPKDLLATALYLLGIPPETTLLDHLKRPRLVAGDGRVRSEFFA